MLCDKNSNIRTCDDYFYITRERPAMRRGPAGLHHVYRSKAGGRTNLRLRICEDTLGPLAGIPDVIAGREGRYPRRPPGRRGISIV